MRDVCSGFRGSGFRGLGVWGFGVSSLGFRGWGFRAVRGFRVQGLAAGKWTRSGAIIKTILYGMWVLAFGEAVSN